MAHLTPREKEIMTMLATGMSTKEIANALLISFHTVESHRKNLREKFEAKNSSELIMKVRRLSMD
jgi:DNA-binding CsgD family transcriptional regulator